MDILKLPKGGVNKGKVVNLRCNCPPGCVCGSAEQRNWRHKPCSELMYISEYGDIFCKHHRDKCDGYFIKDAQFQCSEAKQSNSCKQFKSAAQFLMAIAQGQKEAEFTLGANVLLQFSTTLNQEVIKRWYV